MQFHCLIYFRPREGSRRHAPNTNAALAEMGPHTAELKARGGYY